MAAPILQQRTKDNQATAATSVSASFPTAPGANALIAVFAAANSENYSTDPGSISVADNKGNSYLPAVTQQVGLGLRNGCWLGPAATTGGTFTVVASASGSARWSMFLCEVRGYAISPVEKFGAAAFYDPTFPWSPLNWTATSAAEQLILGCLHAWFGYNRDFSAGTGFTQEDEYGGNLAYPTGCLISKSVTSTGTYDPEWNKDVGAAVQVNVSAISIVAGSEGLGGGNVDLAGAATAGAAASGAASVIKQLAINAVVGALATGALSIQRPLTGAAIGTALGSAVLTAFSNVWRVPTNTANGTAVHVMIFAGASPAYGVVAQGTAIVAGGYIDLPGAGTVGAKAFAFVHNYSDNTATTNIRGGPAIATLTSL